MNPRSVEQRCQLKGRGTRVAKRTDKLETVWQLEDHTAAKHEILRRYLGAWFPIMAASPYTGKRIVYIDGFAGPGIYCDHQPGSPLIALSSLVDHPHFERWSSKEFVCVFIEADDDRFASLSDQLDQFWAARGGQPPNVKVVPRHATFEEEAESILTGLGKTRLAPTFAFIDPFGFKGVPLDTIARLISFPRCEVFFNFMFNRVNQFLTAEVVGGHMEALFGTEACFDAAELHGEQREDFLLALYEEQLRDAAQLTYVHRFSMVGKQNKPVCSLFYGTRNLTGVRKMKDAMWNVDPAGGVRFSDRTAGMMTLFEADPDLGPLRAALVAEFNGRTVSIEDIDRFVVGDTPYRDSHFKKQILKPLEQDGHIEVLTPRRRVNTYPAQTQIRFNVT